MSSSAPSSKKLARASCQETQHDNVTTESPTAYASDYLTGAKLDLFPALQQLICQPEVETYDSGFGLSRVTRLAAAETDTAAFFQP